MKKPIQICKECAQTHDDCDCAEDDGTPIRQRGGARKGAGRKPGTGTGRTVTTSSINLPPTLWEKLDRIRGKKSRSKWISDKVAAARGKS